MDPQFEKLMINLVSDISSDIIKKLSKEFNFDPEQAKKILHIPTIKVISDNEKKSSKKTNIPLPFCGKIFDDCCHGIRLNHGLYTQCSNPIKSYDYDYPVCQTCVKQCQNNSNNQPSYGFIEERLERGADFTDNKGKKPVKYGNIMLKLEITPDQAREEANKIGIEIPEDEFLVEKIKRGRPRKIIAVDDTPSISDASSVTSEKPKRGRPKKVNKEIITTDSKDILLDKLKNQVNEAIDSSDDNLSLCESNEEGEVSVECVKIVNKKLITIEQNEDGSIPKSTEYLYNPSTKDLYTPSLEDPKLIGVWNGNSINYATDDSD